MVHQDRFNQGCNWVISAGKYTGGRIWVEDAKGRHHPPGLPDSPLRGQYYDTRYKWLKFNPKLKHAVEPATGTDLRGNDGLGRSILPSMEFKGAYKDKQ
eukprot:5906478-Amphidinium_carterae.1